MNKTNIIPCFFIAVLAVMCGILPAYAQDSQRDPIDINLIIDGSNAYSRARNEINSWLSGRLDEVLASGDRVTVWSAGQSARVIYTGVISEASEKDALKNTIRDLSVSGDSADFSGAIRDAAGRQGAGFSYTLLISASPQSITGEAAGSLRFSRVEEFSSWRALVVGLNMDAKVKSASDAYFR